MGFRVCGLEFRVWGLGLRVQGLGFRLSSSQAGMRFLRPEAVQPQKATADVGRRYEGGCSGLGFRV